MEYALIGIIAFLILMFPVSIFIITSHMREQFELVLSHLEETQLVGGQHVKLSSQQLEETRARRIQTQASLPKPSDVVGN